MAEEELDKTFPGGEGAVGDGENGPANSKENVDLLGGNGSARGGVADEVSGEDDDSSRAANTEAVSANKESESQPPSNLSEDGVSGSGDRKSSESDSIRDESEESKKKGAEDIGKAAVVSKVEEPEATVEISNDENSSKVSEALSAERKDPEDLSSGGRSNSSHNALGARDQNADLLGGDSGAEMNSSHPSSKPLESPQSEVIMESHAPSNTTGNAASVQLASSLLADKPATANPLSYPDSSEQNSDHRDCKTNELCASNSVGDGSGNNLKQNVPSLDSTADVIPSEVERQNESQNNYGNKENAYTAKQEQVAPTPKRSYTDVVQGSGKGSAAGKSSSATSYKGDFSEDEDKYKRKVNLEPLKPKEYTMPSAGQSAAKTSDGAEKSCLQDTSENFHGNVPSKDIYISIENEKAEFQDEGPNKKEPVSSKEEHVPPKEKPVPFKVEGEHVPSNAEDEPKVVEGGPVLSKVEGEPVLSKVEGEPVLSKVEGELVPTKKEPVLPIEKPVPAKEEHVSHEEKPFLHKEEDDSVSTMKEPVSPKEEGEPVLTKKEPVSPKVKPISPKDENVTSEPASSKDKHVPAKEEPPTATSGLASSEKSEDKSQFEKAWQNKPEVSDDVPISKGSMIGQDDSRDEDKYRSNSVSTNVPEQSNAARKSCQTSPNVTTCTDKGHGHEEHLVDRPNINNSDLPGDTSGVRQRTTQDVQTTDLSETQNNSGNDLEITERIPAQPDTPTGQQRNAQAEEILPYVFPGHRQLSCWKIINVTTIVLMLIIITICVMWKSLYSSETIEVVGPLLDAETITLQSNMWKEGDGLKILVLGRLGTGKSTFVQGMFEKTDQAEQSSVDRDRNKPGFSLKSLTVNQVPISVIIWSQPKIEHVDSKKLQELQNYDLVLFMIKMSETRFPPKDSTIMKTILEVLGPKFISKTVFVLTYANQVGSLDAEARFQQTKEILKSKTYDWKNMIIEKLNKHSETELKPSHFVHAGYPSIPMLYEVHWPSQVLETIYDTLEESKRPALARACKEFWLGALEGSYNQTRRSCVN